MLPPLGWGSNKEDRTPNTGLNVLGNPLVLFPASQNFSSSSLHDKTTSTSLTVIQRRAFLGSAQLAAAYRASRVRLWSETWNLLLEEP